MDLSQFSAPREKNITFELIEDVQGVGRKGQAITMALTPQDTFVTSELDTFLGGYTNADFRADEVAPPILVDKETAQVRNLTKNNTFKRVVVDASLQGRINEVDPETELKTYTATHRALGCFVPAITQGQSVFDVMAAAAVRINTALALDREIRLWTKLVTSGNWNAANRVTLAGTFQWGNPEGAATNPIFDLNNRKLKSAARITDWWMSQEVSDAFLRNTKVKDHMRQMLGDQAPAPQIAQAQRADFVIPGVGVIHVVDPKVLNESTGNLDEILNDSAIGTHVPAGSIRTGEELATIDTFRVRGPSGTGFMTRQVFLDTRGYAGGTLLIVGHQEDIIMRSDSIGGVIFDVIQ